MTAVLTGRWWVTVAGSVVMDSSADGFVSGSGGDVVLAGCCRCCLGRHRRLLTVLSSRTARACWLVGSLVSGMPM